MARANSTVGKASSGGSILRQVFGVLGGIELTDMIGGAFEHELELAADGDELPAFPGAAEGIRGGEDVQAAGKLLASRGFANAGKRASRRLLSKAWFHRRIASSRPGRWGR